MGKNDLGNLDFSKVTAPVAEPKRNLTFELKLDADEEKAREEGTLQANSGVIRTSDSPNTAVSTKQSNKSLYDKTLGITKYESLRKAVGLADDESYTDYVHRGNKIPEGYEMDSKLLIAEEKRKKYFSEYQEGKIGKYDFLYKAYGKDILKENNHDLSSSLYWYNRRNSGDTSSILDDTSYMEKVLAEAEAKFEQEEWNSVSNTTQLSDTLATYVTGEVLDASTLRELMPEAFDAIDEYYENDTKILSLYRAGLIQGFNPVIDINKDGKADYYLHTDGKLYAVEGTGSKGEGTHKAYAYYNNDGSLNRITLINNECLEIADATAKGLVNFFTGVVDFAGMLGGGILDLIESPFTGKLDFDKTLAATEGFNKFKNNCSFIIGNSEYVADSGFLTSDGDANTTNILKGVGSAVGMIAAIAVTLGVAAIAGSASATASGGAQAAVQGTKVATKAGVKAGLSKVGGAVGKGAKAVGKGFLKTAQTLTGISNGGTVTAFAKKGVQYATLESAMWLATRDLLQTGSQLYANKKILGLSDGEIWGKALTVTAVDFAITMGFRATNDVGATTRWKSTLNKLTHKVQTKTAESAVDLTFKQMIKSSMIKNPRRYLAVNFAMDLFENFSTNLLQTSMATTGELFNAEAFKSQITNPAFIAQQVWAGVASIKGPFGKSNEGLQTGSVLDKIKNLTGDLDTVISTLRQSLVNASPEEYDAINAYISKIGKNIEANTKAFLDEGLSKDATDNTRLEQGNDEYNKNYAYSKAITKELAKINDDLKNTPLKDLVIDTIKKDVDNTIKQDVLTETGVTIEYYNAYLNTRSAKVKELLNSSNTGANGKYSLRALLIKKEKYIKEAMSLALTSSGLKTKVIMDNWQHIVLHDMLSKTKLKQTDVEKINNLMEVEQCLPSVTKNSKGQLVIGDLFKAKENNLSKEDMAPLINDYKKGIITEEALANGILIKVPGSGTSAESTPEYQTIKKSLSFLKKLIDYDTEPGTFKLMYAFGKHEDIFFMPASGLNLGSSLMTAYNLLEIARGIYGLKFSADKKVKANLIKEIQEILSEDKIENLPERFNTPNLLTLLFENKLLSLEEASSLYSDLSAEDKSKIDATKPFVKYTNAKDIVSSMAESIKKYNSIDNEEQKKAVLEKDLRPLFEKFINTINADIEKELISNGILTKDFISTVKDCIINKNEVPFIKRQRATSSSTGAKDSNVSNAIRFIASTFSTLDDFDIELDTKEYLGEQIESFNKHSNPYKSINPNSAFTEEEAKVIGEVLSLTYSTRYNKTSIDILLAPIDKVATIIKNHLQNNLTNNINTNYQSFKTPEQIARVDTCLKTYLADIRINLVDKMLSGYTRGEKLNILNEMLYLIQYSKDTQLQFIPSKTYKEARDKFTLFTDAKDFCKQLYIQKGTKLQDRLIKSYEYIKEIQKGSVSIESDGYVHVNFTELVGKTLFDMMTRATQASVQQGVASNLKADNVRKELAVYYGENIPTNDIVTQETYRESLQTLYPNGIKTFDLKNPADKNELDSILTKLGYNITQLYINKTIPIPGVYYKDGYDSALSFEVADADKVLFGLGTSKAYSENQEFKKEIKEDVVTQLDSLLGGICTVDDATIINPQGMVYNSIDVDSAEADIRYTYQSVLNLLKDALNKNGKLGGIASQKLLALGQRGIGISARTNPILRKYEIILTSIDILSKATENALAQSMIRLTPKQYKEYKANGLWKLVEASNMPQGSAKDLKYYYVDRKYTNAKDFKEAAYTLLISNTEIDLNWIVPCYDCNLDSKNVGLTGDYSLNNQSSIGNSPISKLLYEQQEFATAEEIVTLMSSKFIPEYKNVSLDAEKKALAFITGKTYKEVMEARKNATTPEQIKALDEMESNPYYVLLLNTLKASRMLSDYMRANADEEVKNLIDLLGNRDLRIAIGKLLYDLPKSVRENPAKVLKIMQSKEFILKVKNDSTPEYSLSKRSYLNESIEIDTDTKLRKRSNVNGGDTYIMIKNTDATDTLSKLTVDDVKQLLELIEFTTVQTEELLSCKPNVNLKLLTMLEAANSGENKLNIFLDSFMLFTDEEMLEVKAFFKKVLSKKDYKTLEKKLNLITDLSYKNISLFNNKNEVKPEEAKPLVQDNLLGTSVSQIQTTQAVRDSSNVTSKSKDALARAYNYAVLNAQLKKHVKPYMKLSDLDATNILEKKLMHRVATFLSGEVLPNINRKASLLVQNLDIIDFKGQLIDSLASFASTIEQVIFENNKINTTNGVIVNPDIIKLLKDNPQITLGIALKMYINSTNVDFQSEWCKYIFVDLKTGKILDTAQSQDGYKQYMDMLRKTKELMTDPDAKFLVIEMDKNMMLRTATDDAITYYCVTNQAEKDFFANLYATQGLQVFKNPLFNRAYYKSSSANTGNEEVDKISYAYAHCPTLKSKFQEIKDIITQELGLDEDTANLLMEYDFEELQSSKMSNSQRVQLFQNTLFATTKLTKEQRHKFNKQMARINDILKYGITYDSLPEDIDIAIKTQTQRKKYIKSSTDNSKRFVKNQLLDNITIAIKNGDDGKIQAAIREYRNNIPKKFRSEEDCWNLIVENYLLNSKEAGAISYLITKDIDYLDNLPQDSKILVDINYKTIPLNKILANGFYTYDIESFYNERETIPYQLVIRKWYIDVNGELKEDASGSKTIYIPNATNVSMSKLNSAQDYETFKQLLAKYFPDFYATYFLKNVGTQISVEAYFKSLTSGKPQQSVQQAFEDIVGVDGLKIGDIPLVSFRGKDYDNKYLSAYLKNNGKIVAALERNSLDIFEVATRCFLPIQDPSTVTNRKTLLALTKQFLGIKDSGNVHDAGYDNELTARLCKYIVENTINIETYRTDIRDTLNKLYNYYYDVTEVKTLKELLDTYINKNPDSTVPTFDIDNVEYLRSESKKFIKQYRDNYKKDTYSELMTKVKNKIDDFNLEREYEIQFKKKTKIYREDFKEVERKIVSQSYEKKNVDRLLQVMAVLYPKFSTPNELINALGKVAVAFKKDDEASLQGLSNMLEASDEELCDVINTVVYNGNLTLESFDRFNLVNAKKLTSSERAIFDNINSIIAQKELSYDSDKDNIYLAREHQTLSLANKNFNAFFEGMEEVIPEDLVKHIQIELNTFYNDTQTNLEKAARKTPSKHKVILDSMTEQAKELAMTQPIKRISYDRIYKFITSSYNMTLKSKDKKGTYTYANIGIEPNKIYLNTDGVKRLFGVSSIEELHTLTGTKSKQPIYIPIIRQPLDKPGAFHVYELSVNKNYQNAISMSPDTLKALQGGDFDGDKASAVKLDLHLPSKEVQSYYRKISQLSFVGWNLFSNFMVQNKTIKPRDYDIQIILDLAKLFTTQDLAYDMNILVNTHTESYETLREKARNKILHYIDPTQEIEFLKNKLAARNKRTKNTQAKLDAKMQKKDFYNEHFSLDDIDNYLDYVWIKQGPDMATGGLQTTQRFAYTSLNVNVEGSVELSKLNSQQIDLIKTFRQEQYKTSTFVDSGTGVYQKALINNPEIETDIKKIFNYAPFDLSEDSNKNISNFLKYDANAASAKQAFLASLNECLAKYNVTSIDFTTYKLDTAQDFINAIRLVEYAVYHSDVFVNIVSTALKDLYNAYDSSTDPIVQNYRAALGMYAKATSGKTPSYIDGISSIGELIDEAYNGFDTKLFDSNTNKDAILSRALGIVRDRMPKEFTETNIACYDGGTHSFNNYVTGKIVYRVAPKESGITMQDTFMLGEGAKNIINTNVIIFPIPIDERISVTSTSKGKSIKCNSIPEKAIEDCRIVQVLETQDGRKYAVFVKDKNLNSEMKVSLLGTSTSKATISGSYTYYGQHNAKVYDRVYKGATLVGNVSELQLKKLLPSQQKNMKLEYYDKNGTRITEENLTEKTPIEYIVATNAKIVIAEDAGTYNPEAKTSTFDEVAIPNSERSLEAAPLFLPYLFKQDANGEIYFDNTEEANINKLLKGIKQGRYQEHNGVYAYKMLLYATLIKYDDDFDTDTKKVLIKNELLNKSFVGESGTYDIEELLKKYKTAEAFEEVYNKMTPQEKALFDEELLDILFKKEVTAVELPKDKHVPQISKHGHQTYLERLYGVISGRKRVRGTVYNSVTSDDSAKITSTYEDTYMPLLEFRNKYNRIASELGGEKVSNISKQQAEDMTLDNVAEVGEGYRTGYSNGYNNTDARFSTLIKNYRGVSTDGKTGQNCSSYIEIVNNRPYVRNVEAEIIPGDNYESRINTNISNRDMSPLKTDSSLTSMYLGNIGFRIVSGFDSNKNDSISRAATLFKPSSKSNISIPLHRQTIQLMPDNTFRPVANMDYSGIDIDYTDYANILKKTYSSATTVQAKENVQKDIASELSASKYEILQETKEDLPDIEDIDIQKLKRKAKNYYDQIVIEAKSVQNVSKKLEDLKNNSYMPREYTEGSDQALEHIYKNSYLSSSGIKIDSSESLEANQIALGLKKEAIAISTAINSKLYIIAELCKKLNVTEYFNEYVYILGVLDRVNRLDQAYLNLYKSVGESKQRTEEIKIQEAKDELLASLPYSVDEATYRAVKFESIFPDIVKEYKEVIQKMYYMANNVSAQSLEPSNNPFFLITPTVRKTSSKSLEAHKRYAEYMYLDTSLYIDKDKQESYQNYAGYNFFASIQNTLTSISKQYAIVNGGRKLRQQGFMENKTIKAKAMEFLKSKMDTFKTIKGNTSAREQFNICLIIIKDQIPRVDLSSLKEEMTLGEKYLTVYEALLNYIDIEYDNITYEDAREKYNVINNKEASASQIFEGGEFENALRAYDFADDLLVSLCISTNEGKQMLSSFGRSLLSNDKTLVDRYGRTIDPDVTKFKRLSPVSSECVDKLIKYYLGNDDDFYANVALDAIHGDVYYMNKSLAAILDKEHFTTTMPGKIKQMLTKTSNIAIKLLMSSPIKLIDRMFKFTGFDISNLVMANPKLLLELGKARSELSAYASSKGAVINSEKFKDLKEFLFSQGVDPERTDMSQILNSSSEPSLKNNPLTPYFDATNKQFTYQTLLVRYAFWLAAKKSLLDGKYSYGSAFYQKKYIDNMQEIRDTNDNLVVTKEGNQAAYIMGQNIGAPGDFPILSKKINGFLAFTTFPLALLRWGKGELASLGTAAVNILRGKDSLNSIKHLTVSGFGILGIYLTQYLIIQLLSDLYGIEDEDEDEDGESIKEKWIKEQAIPNVLQTIIQGTPIMDSFSSINPLSELSNLTITPIMKGISEDGNIGKGLLNFVNTNIVSHSNPFVKTVAESFAGLDIIGSNIISTKDDYTTWENLVRKFSAYAIGTSGANALMRYNNSDYTEKNYVEGIKRALNAELGNTKISKSNKKNYYRAREILNTYLYADESYSAFEHQELYTGLKGALLKAMLEKVDITSLYKIIDTYISKGLPLETARVAIKNLTLTNKISNIDQEAFVKSLTPNELVCIKSAIAYEDYMFPFIDELAEYVESDEESYSNNYIKSYYPSSNYSSNYNSYNIRQSKYFNTRNSYYNYSKNNYSPEEVYNYMINKWNYGQARDINGNIISKYTYKNNK